MTASRVLVRMMSFSLAAILLSAPVRSNAGLTFVDVADTSTAIPGGSGKFTGFGIPAIIGSYIAFDGTGSGGQQGIYSWSGSGDSMRHGQRTQHSVWFL